MPALLMLHCGVPAMVLQQSGIFASTIMQYRLWHMPAIYAVIQTHYITVVPDCRS